MKLHYQIIGSGKPLLVIHGLFGSADNWRSMIKYFSKQNQVISIDLRNHGRSPHSDSQSLIDMAEDIYELCQDLSLNNVIILGHSLGGKVAMQFAELYEKYVEKLIIVDIAPREYKGKHTPLMDAMMALDFSELNSRKQVDEVLAMSIADQQVRQFLLMNLSLDSEQLKWRINLPALKVNYKAFMKAVLTESNLDITSLFIYGEHSDYVTAQDRDEIKQIFPYAEFAAVPAGHWVHAERPQQFKKIVEEFLIK
ncbi:MAG: alpha/beta fold hydrolase [Proteobacteria bacterium]|nr:alpha/beta fold hydrolase [Pseudomonadota bacterium]